MPLRAASVEGRLVPRQGSIVFPGEGEESEVILQARGGPVRDARVVAPPGFEIALAMPEVATEALDFERELRLSGLGEGDARLVVVRATANATPRPFAAALPRRFGPRASFGTLGIFDSVGEASSVEIVDAQSETLFEEGAPLAGRYAGRADSIVVGLAGHADAHAPDVPVQVPIEVRIFEAAGGRATIELQDPLRLLHPSGRWVGAIVLDADAGSRLDMPSYEVFGPRAFAQRDTHLVAVADGATLFPDPATDARFGGALTIELPIRLEGMVAQQSAAPAVLWRLSLMRTGDLDGEAAPTRSASATLATDPAADSRRLLSVERLYRSAVDSIPFAGGVERSQTILAAWQRLPTREPSARAPFHPAYCFPEALGGFTLSNAFFQALACPDCSQVTTSVIQSVDFIPEPQTQGELAEALGEAFSPGMGALWRELGLDPGGPTNGDFGFLQMANFRQHVGTADWPVLALPDRTLEHYAVCGMTTTGADTRPVPVFAPRWRVPAQPIDIDYCERQAEFLQCDVVDVSAADPALRTFLLNAWDYVDISGPETAVTVPFLVNRVCVPRGFSSRCVDKILCNDVEGDVIGEDTFSAGTDWSNLDPISGDIGCRDAATTLRAPIDDSAASTEQLVAACEAELAAMASPPNALPNSNATVVAQLEQVGWNTAASCLHPVRFVVGLSAAAEALRNRTAASSATPDYLESAAVFSRQLERWFRVQTMRIDAASQGASVLVSGPDQDLEVLLETQLERALEGLDLVLDPRFGEALRGLTAAGPVLYADDYRVAFGEGTPPDQPGWNQRNGLVLAVARFARAHAALLGKLLEQSFQRGARQVSDAAGRAYRAQVLLDALLASWVDAAVASDPQTSPPWWSEYQRVRTLTGQSRAQASQLATAVAEGRNPLGIEDVDLPLYFSQIRTDDGSRFTAISDYLLGADGAVASAPAQALVDDASAAFTAARAAYAAEQQRQVTMENDAATVAAGVRTAQREFGETLLSYCGPRVFGGAAAVDISGLVEGGLDLSTCWYDETVEGCGSSVPPETQDVARQARARQRRIEYELCVVSHFRTERSVPYDGPRLQGGVLAPLRDIGNDINRNAPSLSYLLGPRRVISEGYGPRLFEELYQQIIDDPLFSSRLPGPSPFPMVKNWSDRFFELGGPDQPWIDFFGLGSDTNSPEWQAFSDYISPGGTKASPILCADRNDGSRGRTVFQPNSTGDGWYAEEDVACDTDEVRTGELVWPGVPGYEFSYRSLDDRRWRRRVLRENVCLNPVAPALDTLMPQVILPSDPEAALTANPTLRCVSRYDPEVVIERPLSDDDLTNIGAIVRLDIAELEQAKGICQFWFPPPERDPTELVSNPRPPECYSGSLGEQSYNLRTLAIDVVQARVDIETLIQEYLASMRSCVTLQAGNDEIEDTIRAFNASMRDLEALRAVMDGVAIGANNFASCAATAGGSTSPYEVAWALTSCASLVVASLAEIASVGISAHMANVERAHDLNIAALENALEEKQCFEQAEMVLLSMRSLVLDVQRTMQELSAGYLEFTNGVEALRAYVEVGQAEIAEVADSGSYFVGKDPWLSRDVETFERKMRLAQRATYLAVRAVEYEFQQSLTARNDVLSAAHPDDLDAVLDELRQVALTGSIRGAQPAELTELVSLKRNLLQVADRSGATVGERTDDADTRFRQILTDPRYQVFEDGDFVGVEIPFSVAPLAQLGLGNAAGFGIASGNACAQRLWGLNATVVGDPERVFEGLNPRVNLEIRQRNTFYATQCGVRDGIQVASTRPTRNLFAVPGVGSGVDELSGAGEARSFASARVQAALNVEPEVLGSDAYEDGASTELAARLLFGEYALFIPATSLPAVDEAGGPVGDGLRLNEVDDILLRFDYLSVAN